MMCGVWIEEERLTFMQLSFSSLPSEQSSSVLNFVQELNKVQNMEEAEQSKKGMIDILYIKMMINVDVIRHVYWLICG